MKSPTELTKAEVEAIRTGLAAAGGAGAVFTLLLAVRRQRTTEEDSQQQRMTELYTAAADQLGHESAAVRLAGLYALQRLGQTYREQRQAIVNVWCAYLRMPFRDPDAEGLEEQERAERRQEREVRLTVQRLLREHAHSGSHEDEPASRRFWDDELDVDLTGATLYELDFGGCHIHPRTTFTNVTFTGDTWFGTATFTSDAWFDGATFTGPASFEDVTFTSLASFENVTFTDDAWFGGATFTDEARFNGARARYRCKHVWPAGWKLFPAELSGGSEGGDPNVPWGTLVRVSGTEFGAGPDEPTMDAAEAPQL